MKLCDLSQKIESVKTNSAWSRAVKDYASDIIEELTERVGSNFDFVGSPADRKDLLNGAATWAQYSEGGCSLVYDYDIAKRVCSPSELKKTKGGDRDPNGRETWIDVQTRALFQAERLILRLCK